ncbi:MAG: hydrolase, partial [Oscillospiraceae bacterium]
FFTAPASTMFHSSFEGGLVSHSLNVYDCLNDYLSRETCGEKYGMRYSDETIAIVSLLHDICKINTYKTEMRNTKDEKGNWVKVPFYKFDDPMPYGHGEKSVYMITGFMKLTREESFAIRYHMGFSNNDDIRNVSSSFEMFPLSFALYTADMEATFFIEGNKNK